MQYRLLQCDCGFNTCQRCWDDELEQCYHCTFNSGWSTTMSAAYMGVSDDNVSRTVSLERPSPDRSAGDGGLRPLVLPSGGHSSDRMADGVVSSEPTERQRQIPKKIWKRQRHAMRREAENNRATAMTVNNQPTATGPPTEFAPPGFERPAEDKKEDFTRPTTPEFLGRQDTP